MSIPCGYMICHKFQDNLENDEIFRENVCVCCMARLLDLWLLVFLLLPLSPPTTTTAFADKCIKISIILYTQQPFAECTSSFHSISDWHLWHSVSNLLLEYANFWTIKFYHLDSKTTWVVAIGAVATQFFFFISFSPACLKPKRASIVDYQFCVVPASWCYCYRAEDELRRWQNAKTP